MDVPSQKKADNVGEAKQRLRLLSAQFEPLGFIKKRPLRTTGIALLAGLAWGGPPPPPPGAEHIAECSRQSPLLGRKIAKTGKTAVCRVIINPSPPLCNF